MKITNKQKRQGKYAIKSLFKNLSKFGISEKDFLKNLHSNYENENEIFKEFYQFAENFKINSFGFDSYKFLNDNNVFILVYVINFEIKSKLASIFNAVVEKNKYANEIKIGIRVVEENGNYKVVPSFLPILYKNTLLKFQINDVEKIEKTSNKLNEIPENKIIFGFVEKKAKYILRKKDNNWILKEIGIEKDYKKHDSRRQIIETHKDIVFKIAGNGEFYKIEL